MTGETGRKVCATRKTQSLKTVSRQKVVNITQFTPKTQAQTINSVCNLVVWSLKPQVSKHLPDSGSFSLTSWKNIYYVHTPRQRKAETSVLSGWQEHQKIANFSKALIHKMPHQHSHWTKLHKDCLSSEPRHTSG